MVWIGGEVQVGEQKLAFAQHLALDRLRLFDFDDHIGGGKDFLSSIKQSSTGGFIVRIRKSSTSACAFLDDNRVAMIDRLARSIRRHADPKFLWFNLCWAPDFHELVLRFAFPKSDR